MKALLLFSFFVGAQGCGGNLRVEEVEFASHGVTLSGSIVLPANQPMHAAVVFIQGSGKQTRNMGWAERFAKEGIVAMVYPLDASDRDSHTAPTYGEALRSRTGEYVSPDFLDGC